MSRASRRKIPVRPSDGRTTRPAGVAAGLLVFAALGLLLNAETLHDAAARQDQSWRRTVALAVTDRVLAPARATHLTEPKRALRRLRERLQGERGSRLLSGAEAGSQSVLLVGDSVMENVAPPLAARLGDRLGASVHELTQRGIALGLPELYDWPAEVRRAIARTDADLVVVLLTADPQAGRPLEPGAPRYAREYRKLVVELLDAARSGGARVLWLERPPTADRRVDAEQRAASAIIRDAVRRAPGGAFLEVGRSLAGPGGGFEAYREVDGRTVAVRTPDGIHLTPAGADIYAAAAVDALTSLDTR